MVEERWESNNNNNTKKAQKGKPQRGRGASIAGRSRRWRILCLPHLSHTSDLPGGGGGGPGGSHTRHFEKAPLPLFSRCWE